MDSQSLGTLISPSSTSGSDLRTESSSRSARSNAPEREEDFTKDNVASPVDLDCYIQADRITKILDQAIYKVKLCLCLPTLMNNKNMVKSVMPEHHYDDLVYIYDQYDYPLYSSSLQNVAVKDDLKSGNMSMKNRLNPELAHLVYILNNYPALRSVIEDLVNTMKIAYVSYETTPPNPSLEYLLILENFRNLMAKQMTSTAADLLAAKIHTRKVEERNVKLIKEMQEISTELRDDKESFEKLRSAKESIIKKLEGELSILNTGANIKLKKQILDSERQMVLLTRSHAVKYQILIEEDKESQEIYDKTLQSHMVEEKKLRDRRRKFETQLQTWVQKYDIEMTDKQLDLDNFLKLYEEELEKVKELEEKLAEQDKKFVPLMAEREEEYHQEMAEKQRKFLIEHAARVIQTCWRQVVANRAEKKKLKKQIKLKQARQAAEEAAAEKRARAEAAAEKKAMKANKKG